MQVTVDTSELRTLVKRLEAAGKNNQKNIRAVLKTIGLIVLGKARVLCPISPSKSQYISTLVGGKTKRRTFERGFLTRSITSEVKQDSVEIGIPSNAPAQEYAEKIHDEKGKTWQKLGAGSVVKGATDKFIFKAQEQTEPIYMKEVEKLVDKLIASI